jgi:hypothetical protein
VTGHVVDHPPIGDPTSLGLKAAGAPAGSPYSLAVSNFVNWQIAHRMAERHALQDLEQL